MIIREFTSIDWNSFAGCINWPDGKEPLMCIGTFENGKEYAMVLNPIGACLVLDEHPQGLHGGWILNMKFPTQAAAFAFVNGISEPKSLDDFLKLGFIEV